MKHTKSFRQIVSKLKRKFPRTTHAVTDELLRVLAIWTIRLLSRRKRGKTRQWRVLIAMRL